jgi:hypothetical protein
MSQEAEINAKAQAILMEKKKKEIIHCPLISIGQEMLEPCRENCGWYIKKRKKCAIALLGKIVYELELFHPH